MYDYVGTRSVWSAEEMKDVICTGVVETNLMKEGVNVSVGVFQGPIFFFILNTNCKF